VEQIKDDKKRRKTRGGKQTFGKYIRHMTSPVDITQKIRVWRAGIRLS
jgi:hypothetical protein